MHIFVLFKFDNKSLNIFKIEKTTWEAHSLK